VRNLIREVHRRSLWQVLGIYLAGSWVALQVVEMFAETMTLPNWVVPLVWVLLIAGLPMVLATAFVQEGGPGARGSAPPLDESPGSGEQGAEGLQAVDLTVGASPAASPAAPGMHHRLFTWRNSIVGGVLAFALIGLLAVGWLAMRALGVGPAATLVAQGVLEDRAPVILADFASGPADSLLARAATEALRVDLAQSRVITIVEQAQIAAALDRMARPAGSRIDVDLAREIAVREGSQAVIAGEVIPAGGGFVLAARVLAAEDGQELVSHRETARTADDLLPAIDALSGKLRERIGESLTNLRADEPLARVTTPSLEALRKYSQAVWATDALADTERGIALLEEAVELDSAFAMAWRKLGTVLGNRFEQRARQIEAFRNAYRFRDRLTEVERYWATASYYTFVEFEPEEAITAYRNILEIRPDDYRALNNLGNRYGNVLDTERARDAYTRAIAVDSFNLITYQNLARTLYELDRVDEAIDVLAAAKRHFPDNPGVASAMLELAVAIDDSDRIDAELRVIEAAGVSSLFWRATAKNYEGVVAARRGQMAAAERSFAAELEAQEARGLGDLYLDSSMGRAWVELGVRRNADGARRIVEEALERVPLDGLNPLDRPQIGLSQLFAAIGDPRRARELLADRDAAVDPQLRGGERLVGLPVAEGWIAAAEGRTADATAAFDRVNPGLCDVCGRVEAALALDAAGDRGAAIAAYEEYLSVRNTGRLFSDASYLGHTYERLGRLNDETGDLAAAAKYYAMFVDLWSGADEELQPRVRAAQARLEEILREIG